MIDTYIHACHSLDHCLIRIRPLQEWADVAPLCQPQSGFVSQGRWHQLSQLLLLVIIVITLLSLCCCTKLMNRGYTCLDIPADQ